MPALYRLKVHANDSRDRLEERGPDAFEAWVRAPAKQGKANAAALALLATRVGVEAKRLRIVKGAQAPSKIVTVLGS